MKNNHSQGFTLLEVLIAVSILAIILTMVYSVLVTTLNTKEFLEKETEADRVGYRLISMITRDLQATYLYQLEEELVFRGDQERIDFISNSDSLMYNGRQKSDLSELSYFTKKNREESGSLKLIRREDFFIDNNPLAGGGAIKLYDRVAQLQFIYYDERGNKRKKWDNRQLKSIPSAVGVELGIRTDKPYSGERLIKENIRYFRSIIPMMVSPKKPPRPEPKKSTDDKKPGSNSSNQSQ